ncbi:MerR family transcriptional regulator [Nocardia otitidiscaviarum]|uniref:MerR family transcriptional regulator n=1 Tax=Nocardia otitidiscaviarum TaxID=1823 RepID=UPI00190F52D4|nr:MerR family transcriptional regulator [Nocardia otitidiscaviarum]
MSIGELARRVGLPVRTIRFYCDEGILEAQRSPGGHRMFDADSAVERLLLVRRLRALGLGLEAITGVLREERSMAEVIAAESARLDVELKALAWRRVLAPLPRCDSDGWVGWNVPEPPADPSVDDVVAYAELAALVTTPGMNSDVRQQYWRNRPEQIRDGRALYAAVGDVMVDVVPLVADGVRPRPGRELDRFVHAHADARGQQDSPRFREELLGATVSDPRLHRYWALTAQFLGTRVTVGRAHDWLLEALGQSTGGIRMSASRVRG